jgi:hypothetical protein
MIEGYKARKIKKRKEIITEKKMNEVCKYIFSNSMNPIIK